jgi:tetratricopeptide (TPR) repeat protein
LHYFLSLAEGLEQKFFGPHHLAALDQLEAEHDNCRAALDWAWQVGDTESGLQLANALGWFWQFRAHWIEGRTWLDRFRKVSIDAPVSAQARALFFHLELAAACGDTEQVTVLGIEALAWAEKVEDLCLKAWLLMSAAFWAYYPATYFEDAFVLFREAGDQAGICKTLSLLSQRAFQLGDFARASELQAEGIRLARQTGDKSTLAELLMFSACNRWYQRKINQETENLYHESLALHRELRDKGEIPIVLHCLGSIARVRGEIEQARVLFESCLRLAQENGSKSQILRFLISLSEVLCTQDEPERGARILGAIGDMVLSEYSSPGFYAEEALADYERGVTAARRQLGEMVFAAAFAEGKRMSLEQAAVYAVSDAAYAQTV